VLLLPSLAVVMRFPRLVAARPVFLFLSNFAERAC